MDLMQLEIMPNITSLPPSCYTDAIYDPDDDGKLYTERVCTCYSDRCNVASNDEYLPKENTGNIDCKSKFCNSDRCENIGANGVCKGLYCYSGINRLTFSHQLFTVFQQDIKTDETYINMLDLMYKISQTV